MLMSGCTVTPALLSAIDAKPTIVITQTSTALATPTRTISEREDYVRKMLNPTANCQPPCWWGLTPGLTSWQETQEFFRGLNAPIDWISQKRYGVNTVINQFRSIKILLEENDSLLENILIIGDQSSFASIEDFPSYWKGYSPESVLNAYGPPTRVLLWTHPLRRGSRHPYSLLIIYDGQGFVIYYAGFTKYDQVIKIYPRLGEQNNIGLVKIFLQSERSSLPLEHMAEWEYSDKILNGMLPIDEATGMSIEEFYKMFTTENQSGCVETPAKIWEPIE